MKKYYFQFYRKKENHAGSKAVDDCEAILSELGYIKVPLYEKHSNRFIKCLLWLKEIPAVLTMCSESVAVIQHPIYTHRDYFKTLADIKRLKKLKYVFIIHDLDSVRKILPNYELRARRDALMYNMADCIICHNANMHRFLVENGVDDRKIVDLECFDYLVSDTAAVNPPKEADEDGIVLAGNLGRQASEYIYELSNSNAELPLNLYGVKFDESEKGNYNYVGSFSPDALPSIMKGKYGLIWYGNSVTDCGGDYKDYLPYMNPHKVSCYIVSGLPVIISRSIGMSIFVEENGLGIVVDSIENLQETLKGITDEQYRDMKKNVLAMAVKLNSGYFLKRAIARCEAILEAGK